MQYGINFRVREKGRRSLERCTNSDPDSHGYYWEELISVYMSGKKTLVASYLAVHCPCLLTVASDVEHSLSISEQRQSLSSSVVVAADEVSGLSLF